MLFRSEAVLHSGSLKSGGALATALEHALRSDAEGSCTSDNRDARGRPLLRVWSTLVEHTAALEAEVAARKELIWMPAASAAQATLTTANVSETQRSDLRIRFGSACSDAANAAIEAAIGRVLDSDLTPLLSSLTGVEDCRADTGPSPDGLTLITELDDLKRQHVTQAVTRALNIRKFRQKYGDALRDATRSAGAVDFADRRSPARLIDVGFIGPGGEVRQSLHRVLPDSGGGSGLIGTSMVAWLRRHAPDCVRTARSGQTTTAPISGVAPNAVTMATEVVDIAGMVVGGVVMPAMLNVPEIGRAHV